MASAHSARAVARRPRSALGFGSALAVVLVLGAAFSTALGPARARAAQERPAERLEVTADTIEYDRARDLYIAEGHVRVVQGNRSLDARWATFSHRTRLGVASGDVVYRDGPDAIEARFVQFDTRTLAGVVFDGDFDLGEDGLRIAAGELVRTGEDRYRVFDARFTTCRCTDGGRDPWAIKASRSDLHIGGYGTARNTTLQVLGVPVLWVPWLLFPVKTERQSGLLFPEFNLGGRNGLGFGLPIFWAARRDVNVTATPRWSEDRGAKIDLAVETLYGERSRTALFGSYARDEEVESVPPASRVFPPDRWAFHFQHDQEIPGDFRLQADGRFISDNQYVLDFDDLEENRRDRYMESRAFLSRGFGSGDRLAFEAAAWHADDLQSPDNQDRDPFLLQRWADIELEWLSGPLPGVDWLAGAVGLDYERFDRRDEPRDVFGVPAKGALFGDFGNDSLPNAFELGPGPDPYQDNFDAVTNPFGTEGDGFFQEGEPPTDRGHRLTLHPRLSLPRRIAGALEMIPEVGWRETLYWTDDQDFVRRGQVTARNELRMRFARAFESEGQRVLRHELTPRVGWAFVSQADQSSHPLFVPPTALPQLRLRQLALDNVVLDPSDRVAATNRLVFGLDNRFYTGRGAQRRLRGELTMGIDYDFENGGLGHFVIDGQGTDVFRTDTRFHLVVDPDQGRIDSGLASVDVGWPWRIRTYLRYRYVRQAPLFFEGFTSDPERFDNFEAYDGIDQLHFNATVPIFDRWALTYGISYSFAGKETITNAGSVQYVSKCRCWAVGVEIDSSRNESLGVSFRYTLLGFGDVIGNPLGGTDWIRAGGF